MDILIPKKKILTFQNFDYFQILPADGYTTCRRNGSVKIRKEDQGLGCDEPISVPTLLRETTDAYPEVTVQIKIVSVKQVLILRVNIDRGCIGPSQPRLFTYLD